MKKVTHRSPIALQREGVKFANQYRILQDGHIEDIDALKFDEEYKIDGVIRILDEEYDAIDITKPLYTHMNFEFCGHRIGAIYALPRIIQQGYFRSDDDEIPPILSFDNCYIAECVRVQEHVPYKRLHEKDFENSMQHIHSVASLKKAIVQRYGKSMPALTKEDIEKRGVAITTLRIVRKFA